MYKVSKYKAWYNNIALLAIFLFSLLKVFLFKFFKFLFSFFYIFKYKLNIFYIKILFSLIFYKLIKIIT